ncbi:pantetheine-phosphate adenylyltransferase [Mycoplasmopsis opalescens]|uniref:pantetheine-phosphate adenylyltransferase n=1 Tax=Mycoplasmopsis opalescens TaxID=114886 RepID=UPI0004A74A16|nr:pantetheine-phosphate adenylyltransferase [Mycoplasmopsis opalescens]
MKKAIYAGSFDPIHDGHISVIKKALKLFDFLYVIVSFNPDKDNSSNIVKRFDHVKTILSNISPNIEVLINKDAFIADIAREKKVNFLVRSARNDTDYNLEVDMAAGNKLINNDLETVLIIPDYSMLGVSSTLERHKSKLQKEKNV